MYTEKWYNTKQGENPKAMAGILLEISDSYKKLIRSCKYNSCRELIDYHYLKRIKLSNKEYCQIGTYPLDYNFKKIKPQYLIGMSVPPIMTAQIAHEIYLQWLK
jgi:predicted ATP-dependent endonuclease of OLD family